MSAPLLRTISMDRQRGTRPAGALRASPTRCGLALLIAMATVVLILAALTAGLSAVTNGRQSTADVDTHEHLLAGLRCGEQLAVQWVNAQSASIVLPPAGGGILVADDAWSTPQGTGSVRVVLYDGCAGVPVRLAQLGSPLRFALPDAFAGVIIPPATQVDAKGAADTVERITLPGGIGRFPAEPQTQPRIWSEGDSRPTTSTTPLLAPPGLSLVEAISVYSHSHININTAPEALVRASCQLLGIDSADALMERRGVGSFTDTVPTAPLSSTTTGAGPVPAATLAREDLPTLVTTSDCWQALISVTDHGQRRRWWVVLAGNPPHARMVQRHEADR